MKKLYGFHNHQCCPKDHKRTQNLTGDFVTDSAIQRSKSKGLSEKLRNSLTNDEAYGPLTGYSGYHNYRGDS